MKGLTKDRSYVIIYINLGDGLHRGDINMNYNTYYERESLRWVPIIADEIQEELKNNPDSDLKELSHIKSSGLGFELFHKQWFDQIVDYVKMCCLCNNLSALTNTMCLHWGIDDARLPEDGDWMEDFAI